MRRQARQISTHSPPRKFHSRPDEEIQFSCEYRKPCARDARARLAMGPGIESDFVGAPCVIEAYGEKHGRNEVVIAPMRSILKKCLARLLRRPSLHAARATTGVAQVTKTAHGFMRSGSSRLMPQGPSFRPRALRLRDRLGQHRAPLCRFRFRRRSIFTRLR